MYHRTMRIVKKLFLTIGVWSCILIASCSSNNEIGPALTQSTALHYLPLDIGNAWTYTNLSVNDDFEPFEETLQIHDTTNEFDTSGFLFQTDSVQSYDIPRFTSLLTQGQINQVDKRLVYNGEFNFDLSLSDTRLKIPLKNLIILQQIQPENEQTFTYADSLHQELVFATKTIPVVINYTVKSTVKESGKPDIERSFDEDLLLSVLHFEMEINSNYENQKNYEILPLQEIIQMRLVFSEAIGMVENLNEWSYQLKNLDKFDVFLEETEYSGSVKQMLKEHNLKNQQN